MRKAAVILTLIIAVTMAGCGKTAGEVKKAEAQVNAAVSLEAQANAEVPAETEEKTSAEIMETVSEGKSPAETTVTVSEKKAPEQDADETSGIDAADVSENSSETAADAEEEKELPEYKVTALEEAKIMYASNPVNVRNGASVDFERVGALKRGQEVTVTGQADTDWYEIVYGKEKAYVSDHYLQEEKPAEEPLPQPQSQPEQSADSQPAQNAGSQQTPQPVQAVTEVKNVAGVILVGDSRFVQMQANVGENSCTWIAENGKGYNWLNETAVARIDGCVGKGSKILINLGVNDPGNLKNYLELVNAKAAEWAGKGASIYYASVNPVWENPYVTEEQVEYFNSQMQSGLSGDVHWIDSHSYLGSIGYKLVDGLHYNAETYQNLYAYFMSCL